MTRRPRRGAPPAAARLVPFLRLVAAEGNRDHADAPPPTAAAAAPRRRKRRPKFVF